MPNPARSSQTPFIPTVRRLDSLAYGPFYQVEGQSEPFPSVAAVLSCLGQSDLLNGAASEERKLIVDAAADLYQDAHGTPLMLRAVYTDTLLKRVTKVKAHQRQLAKAGEIGSQVHRMVEWWLRKNHGQQVGPEPPLSPDAAVAFVKFEEWAIGQHLIPGFLEVPVWSVKYRYAGTLDFYGWLRKTPVVLDWKTSSAVYLEHHLQVASYMHALRELKQGVPKTAFIVRFPKKAGESMEIVEVVDWRQRFKEFLKVRAVWEVWHGWQRAQQEKRARADEGCGTD